MAKNSSEFLPQNYIMHCTNIEKMVMGTHYHGNGNHKNGNGNGYGPMGVFLAHKNITLSSYQL